MSYFVENVKIKLPLWSYLIIITIINMILNI